MTHLEPGDQKHVDAAEGWIGFGNWSEANEALERVSPGQRDHPDVLSVRWRVHALAGRWDTAVELAEVLMRAAPNRRAKTLYALAVHACRLNRVEEGRKWIDEALELGGMAMKEQAMDDPQLRRIWQR
jgi:tetratricopeptide (TPR) repeat protein